MAALAADKVIRRRLVGGASPYRRRYKMKASTTIYKGAMVNCDANGVALPAAETAGTSTVVGIATHQQTSAASGNYYIEVEFGCEFLLDVAAGITIADTGTKAFLLDDQTVTDAAGTLTADILAGTIVEYLDETQDKAWIYITGISA